MRLPAGPSLKIVGQIVRRRIFGPPRFPLVLQLEPLHACNLACVGCGRIREYAASAAAAMPLAECLAAARECGAPMVSICGGEPLLYPEIAELVGGLRRQRRFVFLCTNGLLLRRFLLRFLAAEYRRRRRWGAAAVARLLAAGVLAASEAERVRAGAEAGEAGCGAVIRPSAWFYWNVHLDGLETSHDALVGRSGVFRECVAAVRMAKLLGFRVATNTTVYAATDMGEIEALFELLGGLGVDGHTLSPGFGYEAVAGQGAADGGPASEFFPTRQTTVAKFQAAASWPWRFPLLGTLLYFEFLAGRRALPCSAWAIPTRNARGWKGPCYLLTDAHYASYGELLRRTRWDELGVRDGVAQDARCAHCMAHCGYEPSAVLGAGAGPRDWWDMARFHLGGGRRRAADRTASGGGNGSRAG